MHKFAPIAFICLILTSCGNLSSETIEAELALFHDRFNAEEFQAIYDASSEDFKSGENEENTLQFFRAIRGKLGTFQDSKQTRWFAKTSTKGSRVEIVLQSTFENGTGAESFVFISEGDNARLHSYNINSRALIMDLLPQPTNDSPSSSF
jgi:hypothetical protein